MHGLALACAVLRWLSLAGIGFCGPSWACVGCRRHSIVSYHISVVNELIKIIKAYLGPNDVVGTHPYWLLGPWLVFIGLRWSSLTCVVVVLHVEVEWLWLP
jgi:hypothetical protein